MKFLKSLIIFSSCLLLYGCEKINNNITPTNTVTTDLTIPSPVPSPSPSITPEPSPTVEMVRWDVLLPKDLNICKEINKFSQFDPNNLGKIQSELIILLEKEKANSQSAYIDDLFTINLKDIKFDFGDDPKTSKRPNLIVFNEFNPVFTSCSYLPFTDSEGLYVLGLTIRRNEYEKGMIIHIALDDAGLKTLISAGGLNPYQYDLENSYQRIISNEIKGALIALVNSKGESSQDGPWKKSLDLLNVQPIEDKNKLPFLISRYFNSDRKLDSEEIIKIQSVLENYLLPCFGLSLQS